MTQTANAKRTAETLRNWKGAALWSRGFRPLFLAAATWAVIAIAIWTPFVSGEIQIPTAFSPIDWHIHEMIYGYGTAVVAGFLLTAIPNWTGRLPVTGWPLAGLCALWASGRCAVLESAIVGPALAAVADTLFLLVFASVVAREVVASRNTRNLKVVIVVLVFALANVGFHVEAAITGTAPISARLGLAILVFLILLIGGRIVPSFTHNWLAKHGIAARPVSFGRPDGAVMILSGAALALWVTFPGSRSVGAALVAAGVASLWRLSRWRGWTTGADRLVLILHVGFLLAALGFLIVGAGSLFPNIVPRAAGLHVWAIGAVGTMTLAMMTRTTLGHTGRELRASAGTQAIYLAIIVAMIARVAMAFTPTFQTALLHVAAGAWIIAFLGYVALFGPMLARPRLGAE
jgi:uncharacterized protein involved in response to NO